MPYGNKLGRPATRGRKTQATPSGSAAAKPKAKESGHGRAPVARPAGFGTGPGAAIKRNRAIENSPTASAAAKAAARKGRIAASRAVSMRNSAANRKK